MQRLMAFLLLWLAALPASGQGVHFHHGDLASLFARAKKENTAVYVDVYTTWCGPCRAQAREAFSDSSIGTYMNAHFISYKIEGDKGEGIALSKKYAIDGVPTSLFFTPAAELAYQASGYSTKEAFMKEARTAVDELASPDNLMHQRKAFDAGRRDTAFLCRYLQKMMSLEVGGRDVARAVDALYERMPETERQDLRRMGLLTLANSHGNPGIYRHSLAMLPALPKYDTARAWQMHYALRYANDSMLLPALEAGPDSLDVRFAERRRIALTFEPDELAEAEKDEAGTRLHLAAGPGKPAWVLGYQVPRFVDTYLYHLSDSALDAADSLHFEPIKALTAKDLKELGVTDANRQDFYANNRKLGRFLISEDLNRFAWGFYKAKCPAPQLEQALTWLDYGLELNPKNHAALDTKAHLLFALGKKPEAVATQKKAIATAADDKEAVTEYQAFLKEIQPPARRTAPPKRERVAKPKSAG